MTDTQENNDKQPTDDAQPASNPQQAKKKLLVAVVFFSMAAVIIFVLQILPAKFGIDLTGYGTYVGLIQIYETEQLREQMRDTKNQQQQVEIEIAAGEELEYKLYLLKDDPLGYSWKTDQGEIYAEFHGELKGAHGAILQTYDKSAGSEKQETWTAPFEGTHGWYWRNDNDFAVKVSLETKGKYNTLGRKKAAFSRK